MVYCEDCKWFKTRWNDFGVKSFGGCHNPKAETKGNALVSRRYTPFATLERGYGVCGEEGKNFEAKDSENLKIKI